MNQQITKILNKIENNGFEAYIVGGYVRDYLLGISSTDIDICTNALPKDLINIFNANSFNNPTYGSFRLRASKYTFDITTYRKEGKYHNRRPTEIQYIHNLLEDLQRRDFTINAICMTSSGEIIDPLGGRTDLQNRLIKCIGDTKTKLKEDPLRILRAVRFCTILNFNLDPLIAKEIKKNGHLIKNLSYQRKREELDRILLSPNVKDGLNLLKSLNLYDLLEISHHNLVPVNNLCAMYAQLTISNQYPFTKLEKNTINNIKNILKIGTINNHTLYKYGLYINQLSAKILNIDVKNVNSMYESLPLKSPQELALSHNSLATLTNLNQPKKVKELSEKLINLVLDEKLPNTKEALTEYITQGGE